MASANEGRRTARRAPSAAAALGTASGTNRGTRSATGPGRKTRQRARQPSALNHQSTHRHPTRCQAHFGVRRFRYFGVIFAILLP